MLPTGRVLIMPIQKGPIFAISEGSFFCHVVRVFVLPTRKGQNPESSNFCQLGRVSILPIRNGPIFLSIWKGSNFAKPKNHFFANSEGS